MSTACPSLQSGHQMTHKQPSSARHDNSLSVRDVESGDERISEVSCWKHTLIRGPQRHLFNVGPKRTGFCNAKEASSKDLNCYSTARLWAFNFFSTFLDRERNFHLTARGLEYLASYSSIQGSKVTPICICNTRCHHVYDIHVHLYFTVTR